MAEASDFDILVVGAGILGATTAYWLSGLYDCTIALADVARSPGAHTSSRNTGVIHRPYYLDPAKKRVFARTALLSRRLWESLAKVDGLPWRPIGTYNVAVDEREVRTVEKYRTWGVENGMDEGEMEFLDGAGVRSREPEVRCRGALFSKTDVSVDFGAFTRSVWRRDLARGVRFLAGQELVSAARRPGAVQATFRSGGSSTTVRCRLLVNAAGGGALKIAHSLGFGRGLAALHFRGEYWVVDEPFASRVTSNIYRPPEFPQYPFLDPHFVVRADGSRQIGPNAVVVPGPYVYSGLGLSSLPRFLERPPGPKARLFANSDFLSLVAGEWRSSLSKRAMCARVRRFIPALSPSLLNGRVVFGVRSSVVDRSGFVPEALLFKGEGSAHVVNFNSPGATGAPAFSAMVVKELGEAGFFDGFRPREPPASIPGWDFTGASEV
ncbi:MAG: FAD-dependent oxidoreductase [Nitrososphaerota archaeon]|nr:FAD-dependent oxidoreductase [Nitrososphaerota archaeon]MDG6953045.1 FAD-dependent oxidoreductase [Nitrososphaerota archaeon]MDG6955878.1 FAD-dependent oxidoreductase [Nitrososphaerota archaeon]MDG6957380.1 FAD-dependent oxidoreductase [Nitrososphaerota archaeon]MDG6959316.1 FAD-dependent oxidoreductase [Nitrososphaerota archaeon]